MVCSEQLVDARKRLLPEFSKYKFGGQLRPTNMVARWSFRAIPGNRANGVVEACSSVRKCQLTGSRGPVYEPNTESKCIFAHIYDGFMGVTSIFSWF